jgi:hypothetical protein
VHPPRRWPIGARFYLRCAIAGIAGGLLLIFTPRMFWQGVAAMAVGALSLFFAFRPIGRREPESRRAVRGPDFAADDPEVAALPPTTTTRLSEQVKQARERQRREQG